MAYFQFLFMVCLTVIPPIHKQLFITIKYYITVTFNHLVLLSRIQVLSGHKLTIPLNQCLSHNSWCICRTIVFGHYLYGHFQYYGSADLTAK